MKFKLALPLICVLLSLWGVRKLEIIGKTKQALTIQ